MKKIIILLVVLVSMSTYAQHRPEKQNNQKRFAQNFTSEQNATLKSKKMALHLDLNTAQQNKIYALILKQEQKRDQFRIKRQSLKDDEMKITPEKRFEMMDKGLDAKLAFQSEMKTILSPKQYEIWKKHAKKNDDSRFRKPEIHQQKRRS
ncbi:MAG: hypothetical protein HQ471_05385 [Flavobacteriales bacterium]|nr:hypothetical protein [Flavobacteriales bacterium]